MISAQRYSTLAQTPKDVKAQARAPLLTLVRMGSAMAAGAIKPCGIVSIGREVTVAAMGKDTVSAMAGDSAPALYATILDHCKFQKAN